jgi:ATP-dependent DNA helicase RecG
VEVARTALLMFHEDPERWFTGAYVKLGMFRSYTELLFHDDIHGDLFWQMEHTMKLLLEKYMIAWVHFEGLQRIERYPIPPPHCAKHH